MTERSRTPPLRRRRAGRRAAGAVYVEVLVAIIPVLIFFFGLLQLALLHTARLVVRHAAQRAVRSAVVVLEDDPARFDNQGQGEVTYHDTSSTSAGGTAQFLQGIGDVLKVKLPLDDVNSMMGSQAGPRLAAIQRNVSMWQLESDATKASSGSTACASDIGNGTDDGADEPGTSMPPSKRIR